MIICYSWQFEFDWEVSQADTPENGLFMRHEEKAEESNPGRGGDGETRDLSGGEIDLKAALFFLPISGRTDGMYQVWFEDGRLMTVT